MSRKSKPAAALAAEEAVLERAPEPAPEARCYIGPPTLGVMTGTIYIGDLPPELQKALDEKPIIGKLVVPVSQLPAANRDMANPDSAMRRFYRAAAEFFKGGKR